MSRTSIATDNFNRATLGTSNWAQLNTALAGDVTVDSSVKVRGQYSTQPTNQKAVARWIGSGSFTDNQYALIKLLNPPPADFSGGANVEVGVVVRASADTGANKDFYEVSCVHVVAGTTNLCKWSNGTRTLLATASVSYSANDTLEIEAIGTAGSTVITAYKNGTAISGLSYTDTSALTGGVPGVTASGAALFGDDWEGGTVSAPASLTFTGTVGSQTGTVSSAFSWGGSALDTYFSGGTTPYSYAVLSGSLPAGLSLNSSTGVVSGTPTTAGVSTIVIRATDSAGSPTTADTNSFTITISAAAATATTMTGPSGGLVGVASTAFTVGANGAITGTVTITPSDGIGGGTFTPTSVSISSTTPTNTFVYTPATGGTKTISISDNGGLTDAASLTYNASTTSGTLTSSPLKNNTGTLLAATAFSAYVHTPSTGALVVLKTGITTDSSGIATFTDGAVVATTSYRVVWKATTSGAEGMETLTAT